jgi:tetratricopeptide (TPR) repeat protein
LAEAGFTLSALAGDHGDASAAIDRALILNANSADAWTYRGWVACYRNDPGRAIDAFDRAMRLSPLDPRAWHFAAGRGLAHMIAGEYQNAVEWADRSLSVLPRFGPTLRTKIVGCVQQGRIAEARAVLARMNRLQPNWTIASFKAATEKIFPPEVLAVYVDGLRKAGMPEE